MYPKIGIFDSYSLMVILGLIFALVFIEIYRKKKKLNRILISIIEINGLISAFIGFIGAVLFQNLYDFIENPATYKWSWAMTFYGGLVFGILSFLLGYFLFIKKKFGPCLEKDIFVFVPSCIAIAQGFGRIGCFLAGCCYGKGTTSWIGITFPNGIGKVIPTNLMEALFLIILGVSLLLLSLTKNGKFSLPVYLFSYSIWRFMIEFYRGDHRGEFIKGLSPSQFWSIIMFLIGIGYLAYLLIYKKRVDQERSTL